MNTSARRFGLSMAAVAALAGGSGCAQRQHGTAAGKYSWQEQPAKVLDTGDLQWSPRPFVYEVGSVVRYIDFDGGDDANDGTTKAKAWKHHPWDRAATGVAARDKSANTYVFKRGVVYRGALMAGGEGEGAGAVTGTKEEPIRLTSDPDWGKGEAVICGATPVSGWTLGGMEKTPEASAGKVWKTDLSFAPRRLWIRAAGAGKGAGGKLQRLTLARTPNWQPSNPEDYREGWYSWEQPEWWTGKNKVTVNGTKMHLGIDTKHLSGDPEQYKDALVWTEYGIVMGSPYATKVEQYDPEKKAVAIQGAWGGDSETLIANNRYYLEDKPQFLDEAGEYWFERKGNGGTLYLRAPGDVDPNTLQIEAAERYTLLDATKLEHVRISGLTFQGNNTYWDLTARPFVNKEIESQGIRLQGSGDDITISHCKFEQLTAGVKIKAEQDTDRIGTVQIADSEFADLDRGCILVGDSNRWGKSDGQFGPLEHVEVLRNYIYNIGFRGGRDCHGHTIVLEFPDTAEVAGNVLERVGGAGIFLFGGKASGEMRDKPLSRTLIHHNKVTQALMVTNDWGGIETWQGGPHYLWSNISANPNGYWNWSFQGQKNNPADKVDWGAARQGFAYYFDGSFKNYVFNNIAAGANNTPGSPLCNASAFQQCIGFQNTFFNNTAYRFAAGLRRQAPRAGRDKWLGNIMDDMSCWTFLAAEPKEGAQKDANAFQFGDFKGSSYATDTNAWGANVFRGAPRYFGVFDEDGNAFRKFDDFAKAQQMHKAMRQDVGVVSPMQALEDPARGDFRPADNPLLPGKAQKVFVPWGLYANVGEWNFFQNQKDPAVVIDEHWYMAPYYVSREENWKTPRHALQGVNITAADYVKGELDGWTKGAVRLDGKAKYFLAKHEDLVKPFEYDGGGKKLVAKDEAIASPHITTTNFLIETHFRTVPGQSGGAIASKWSQRGYELLVAPTGQACLHLNFNAQQGPANPGMQGAWNGGWDVLGGPKVNDGAWHHVVAEVDHKAQQANLYVDGRLVKTAEITPEMKTMENTADFLVGKAADGKLFAGDIDFLRVCRGTLADARTTIAELYAWEFDGPQYRDFAGRKVDFAVRPAGALAK